MSRYCLVPWLGVYLLVQVCLYSAALLVPVYYDLALVVTSPRNIALATSPLLCSGLLTYWYYSCKRTFAKFSQCPEKAPLGPNIQFTNKTQC